MAKMRSKMKNYLDYYLNPFLGMKDDFVICPICGYRDKEFELFIVAKSHNALCPKCQSLERHRLYHLYLKDLLPKNKYVKLLHIAPEPGLKKFITSYDNIDYLSIDKDSGWADKKEDLTNLSFKDNSYDIIFCSHVLEHIEDDKKAMTEILRVLKPGGFAILQVPVYGIEKTLEDTTIVDPIMREEIFGQRDHVRKYGKDYRDRLEKAGFFVMVDKFYESLSQEQIKRHVLLREDMYVCYKTENANSEAKENETITKLPGTFWAMTTFYNSSNSKNKLQNYKAFRNKLKEQGVSLITVECAFKERSFSLKEEDADILIQVRSNSVLWQKERLLNIALDNLPSDCDKIAWLDADIVILDNDWAKKAGQLLEKFPLVKSFNKTYRLNKDESKLIIKGKEDQLSFKGRKASDAPDNFLIYLSTFGICARRDIFAKVKFYDKMILGSGDIVMANAILKNNSQIEDIPNIANSLPQSLKEDINSWYKEFRVVTGKVEVKFLEGRVLHLFHGLPFNRKYDERHQILEKHQYDYNRDIEINDDGCFEWTSEKPEFQKDVIKYFKSRNEDNYFIKNGKVLEAYVIYHLKIFRTYRRKQFKLFLLFLDRMIGKVGILIKKISPRVYNILKKKFF